MSDSSPKAVFLSYAREDIEAARRIADALRAFGVEVWFDQNELRGGDAWDAKIKQHIRECALFVPVISAHTQERTEGYFRREWKLAAERRQDMASSRAFLVPVVIDATAEAGADVPEEFLRVQWTRLPHGVPSPQFIEQIQRLLAGAIRGPAAAKLEPAAPPPAASAPAESRAASGQTGKRIALGAGVAVALALVFLLVRRSPSPAAASAPAGKASPVVVGASPSAAATPNPAAISAKSIAVLPFANMSDDKDANAFFADGMHEDLLTQLSNIRELQVVSRTTTMQYRDTRKPMRQIGEELKVAFLLEGSVRRAGNTLRITGQLINAATDAHLWAKSYDRELNTVNIFAIQAELAQAIAAELRAAISPEEKALLVSRPTESLAAYDLYLRARALRDVARPTPAHFLESRKNLEEALRLDPNFAAAWAELGMIESRVYSGGLPGGAAYTPAQLARAQTAIDHAVRLAPEAPDVLFALGEFYYRCRNDLPQALAQFEKLRRVRPNDAAGLGLAGAIHRRQGNWPESLINFRRAVELDAGNLRHVFDLKNLLAAIRRFAEARRLGQRILAQQPDDFHEQFDQAYLAFLETGAKSEMEDFLRRLPPERANSKTGLAMRERWLLRTGQLSAVVAFDQAQPDDSLRRAIAMATVLSAQGDVKAARARLEAPAERLRAQLQQAPDHVDVLASLAEIEALLGQGDAALRYARRALELAQPRYPLALDRYGRTLAFVEAWTGQKEAALAHWGKLLQTPYGMGGWGGLSQGDVGAPHVLRHDPRYFPLQGDPRWEALLNDPKNSRPLF